MKLKRIIACSLIFAGLGLNASAETLAPALKMTPVRVSAEKPEENISATTLTSEEMKRYPGALNDPLRAAQAVPGLATESDFDSRLFIRGSAPEDSRVLIDDIAAGFPFHFYGLASTLDINLFQDMKIYTGGFPVEFGNYMGGIVALHTPARAEREACFNLNLIQGGAAYRAPLGEQGLVQGSLRKGFYNLVLANWHEATVLPSYYDYFFKAGWNGLRLYTWGSEDSASVRSYLPSGQTGTADIRQASRNFAAVQRWTWSGVECSALGQYYTEGQNYYFDSNNAFKQDPKSLIGELQARWFGLPDHRLQGRLEFAYQEPQVSVRIADLFASAQDRFSPGQGLFITDHIAYHNYGAALSDHILISPELSATLGLRWDYTTYNRQAYFSPRGQLEFEPDPRQKLRFAAGVFHQEPVPLLLVAQAGPDAANLAYSRALHYIFSYELHPLPAWRQSLEIYYKDFAQLNSLARDNAFASDGRGFARGMEYKTQVAWSPGTSTSLSYVWSESKRYLPETQTWAAFDNDRTHQIACLQQITLNANWSATLRWVWSTGQPFTPAGDGTAAAVNSERLPAYQRLDLRCEYQLPLETAEVRLALDVFNCYNATNTSRIMFNNLYSSAGSFRQFPLLCVLGLSVTL